VWWVPKSILLRNPYGTPTAKSSSGSGNCYAKAFHTEGPDIADQVLENVRKEVEGLFSSDSARGGIPIGFDWMYLGTSIKHK